MFGRLECFSMITSKSLLTRKPTLCRTRARSPLHLFQQISAAEASAHTDKINSKSRSIHCDCGPVFFTHLMDKTIFTFLFILSAHIFSPHAVITTKKRCRLLSNCDQLSFISACSGRLFSDACENGGKSERMRRNDGAVGGACECIRRCFRCFLEGFTTSRLVVFV